MATVITHAIVGAGLASLPATPLPRLKLAIVLATVAMLPDADVIGFWMGIDYGDPLGHRGFTHSIVFALLVAILLPPILFREARRAVRAWLTLSGLVFVATASHGALDAFTDAGLGIGFLIPFDDTRYFASWRPIETSPLSVSRFLSERGVSILRSEFIYVMLPYFTILGLFLATRRALRTTGSNT